MAVGLRPHVLLAFGILTSSSARAADSTEDIAPRSASAFEIAARAGYATAPIRGAVDPFGAGLGFRFGYSFANVYFGAAGTYYVGGSDVGATDRALLFGTAVGYGLPLGDRLTLRPTIGVGYVAVSHTEPLAKPDVVTTASGSTTTRTSVTTTVSDVYVEPSMTAIVSFGSPFVALDAGVLVVPSITYGPAPAQSATWLSYSLEGAFGFRF